MVNNNDDLAAVAVTVDFYHASEIQWADDLADTVQGLT